MVSELLSGYDLCNQTKRIFKPTANNNSQKNHNRDKKKCLPIALLEENDTISHKNQTTHLNSFKHTNIHRMQEWTFHNNISYYITWFSWRLGILHKSRIWYGNRLWLETEILCLLTYEHCRNTSLYSSKFVSSIQPIMDLLLGIKIHILVRSSTSFDSLMWWSIIERKGSEGLKPQEIRSLRNFVCSLRGIKWRIFIWSAKNESNVSTTFLGFFSKHCH